VTASIQAIAASIEWRPKGGLSGIVIVPKTIIKSRVRFWQKARDRN